MFNFIELLYWFGRSIILPSQTAMEKMAFRKARCSSPARWLMWIAVTLIATWCAAQTGPAAKRGTPDTAGQAKQKAAPPKLTPQQEQGLRLLKAVAAEAGGLEADMRAFVLWRASYAYVPIDPKKSESVAKDSFVASEAIEDPLDRDQCGPIGSAGDIKSWIQERVLSEMIKKEKIAEAEELLPRATEPVRTRIATELVKHYVEKKNVPRAEAMLSQLTDAEQYPFAAAANLLLNVGPEQSADRMTIFNQALSNFQQHANGGSFSTDDVGSFIERTWMHVPPALVLEAIDKVLEQTKSQESHSHYSMASAEGSVALRSPYELRLFQLLPVLEELDKDKAESLLRDDAELQAQLKKYPKGMESLTSQGNIYSYGITDDDSPKAAEGMATQQVAEQIRQRMMEIAKESEKDPAQAMADALGLPVQGPSQDSPRAQLLSEIAKGAVKNKPSVAKSALDEILKIEDQLTPQQIAGIANLPKIYLDLGDEDGARKALKPLLKAAEKIYAHDTDADDPNKAFKGTWPSADLWRRCIQVAAKISTSLAEEIIGEIPDPEIAASERVDFASSLLRASGDPVVVSDCRKNGSSYNFSD